MRRLVFLLVMVWLSLSSSAFAQDDAAESFNKGITLFESKKYAEALPLLEKAVDETGSPNARIYVARSLLQLGRLAEAYEEMKTTVEDATAKAETDKRYEPTRDSGAAELAILERKIGKVVIAIASPPPGLAVSLGGREVAADRLGGAIAVAPGKVALSVTAPGHQPIAREIEVVAGKMETVALTLTATSTPAPPPPPPEPPKPEEPTTEMTGGELRIVGFIVGGLGIVGVGIGAGLAAKVDSDFGAIEEECANATCPASFQSRVDDGRSLQLGANIALFAGAGLAVAGVAMIIFGGPTETETTVGIAPMPGGGVFTLGGAF